MTTTIDQILGQFADAWKAGRRPDVGDYLMRAPEAERDELAQALGDWLELAPTPPYDDATLEKLRSDPALVRAQAAASLEELTVAGRVATLRERAGLGIAELASKLVGALGIGARDAETRTASYLRDLEADELDESRLSRRLLRGLADALGARSDSLMRERGPGPAGAVGLVFQRSEDHAGDEFVQEIEALSDAAMASAPEPMDDVDRLFLGGPEG